jgi:nucleoside-diphosphate-sugar epimerase
MRGRTRRQPLTTHGLQSSGVQPVVLRIGTIWGPLVDPESPFFHIPPYINAVPRGEEPRPLHADDGDDPCLDITRLTHDTGFAPAFDVATAVADHVAWRAGNPR